MKRIKNNKLIGVGLFLCTVVLAACAGRPQETTSGSPLSSIENKKREKSSTEAQQEKSSSSEKEKNSSSMAGSSSTNSNHQTQPSVAERGYWNAQKAQRLQDYIFGYWGPALGQEYRSYDPMHDVNFYGMLIPSYVLNPSLERSQFPSMVPDFAGQTPYLIWSENGLVEAGQIALVAVYSDIETTRFPASHLYLFTIQQGRPQVWITEQNQGNPEQILYFRETANEELKAFFRELVAE
ncbi:DUF4767 domain-containing protein [Streptococcus marmotae]|uniref:DUF4767 domain-containing protein n=1 Tax=Streptococcus marmotae TaxID=1825069 RepID=UPI00082F5410|nr:DUF4767 domain-containing protein [Streptococcus marmotae]